jgi:hypothetical protein
VRSVLTGSPLPINISTSSFTRLLCYRIPRVLSAFFGLSLCPRVIGISCAMAICTRFGKELTIDERDPAGVVDPDAPLDASQNIRREQRQPASITGLGARPPRSREYTPGGLPLPCSHQCQRTRTIPCHCRDGPIRQPHGFAGAASAAWSSPGLRNELRQGRVSTPDGSPSSPLISRARAH